MFGFILGILYSDNSTSVSDLRFNTKEVEEEEAKMRYRLKEADSNFIDMEDDDGLVIYHGGDIALHENHSEEIGAYKVKEYDGGAFREDEPPPLFTELGVKTANAFEQAFSRMFSVFDSQ